MLGQVWRQLGSWNPDSDTATQIRPASEGNGQCRTKCSGRFVALFNCILESRELVFLAPCMQWSLHTHQVGVGRQSGSMWECASRAHCIDSIPEIHGCDESSLHREYMENLAV